jgi:hypothetical protein
MRTVGKLPDAAGVSGVARRASGAGNGLSFAFDIRIPPDLRRFYARRHGKKSD